LALIFLFLLNPLDDVESELRSDNMAPGSFSSDSITSNIATIPITMTDKLIRKRFGVGPLVSINLAMRGKSY
jgi:hypothetical protein